MDEDKQIPWYITFVLIIGIIISLFIVATESNFVFKQDIFTKTIMVDSDDENDAGYIMLKRDDRTPSALDWAKFELTNSNYIYFSLSNNEVLEKKVLFNTPDDLESGKYYVGYEIHYVSGLVEEDVITFRVI